jgi:NAD(P)-dependent dehydrogenase (short-subunit alcohol dehydrogenase family)
VTAPAVALVTGATSDIGAAIVAALAAAGNSVGVHYHGQAERAQRIVDGLGDRGVGGVAVCADVSDLTDVRAAVARVSEVLGPPRILVNGAALVRFERFMASDPVHWPRQIEVTLLGCLNCSRVVAETMIGSGGGRIVNIVAEGALVGEPALAVATAAKAGVVGFTRTLALELAPQEVTVNAVSPGFVATSSTPPELKTAERLERIAARYPARRLGTPEDIAAAVAFLCSPQAGYITGQTISVSGGYSVR